MCELLGLAKFFFVALRDFTLWRNSCFPPFASIRCASYCPQDNIPARTVLRIACLPHFVLLRVTAFGSILAKSIPWMKKGVSYS